MRYGIDEQQRIPRGQMALDGAGHPIDGDLGITLLDRHRLWMPEVRLVAAGDDHRCAVPRADIGERHQDVHLPAVELAGVMAELRADGPDVAARMQPLRAARPADGAEALVDEGGSVIAVEVFRIVGADEVLHLLEP